MRGVMLKARGIALHSCSRQRRHGLLLISACSTQPLGTDCTTVVMLEPHKLSARSALPVERYLPVGQLHLTVINNVCPRVVRNGKVARGYNVGGEHEE